MITGGSVGGTPVRRSSAGRCARRGQSDEGRPRSTCPRNMAADISAPIVAPDSSTPMPRCCPGIIDIQSATYDDPDAIPARAHIQVAERIRWMDRAHELPAFERYPPRE
jgi:hypothetical protein